MIYYFTLGFLGGLATATTAILIAEKIKADKLKKQRNQTLSGENDY